jgi:hypothetical protein
MAELLDRAAAVIVGEYDNTRVLVGTAVTCPYLLSARLSLPFFLHGKKETARGSLVSAFFPLRPLLGLSANKAQMKNTKPAEVK